MPISPIVLQRRHAELGRIRLGDKQQTSNGKTRPNKLSSFRFTSPSQRYITDLADLYGGEARQWDNSGKPEWEVYTTAQSIPVIAVKGGLSQWMETWSGGGCVHRCDGERNVEGVPCNDSDPAHLQAKPTTRLSVMLPELEAVGVWRLETHGWNAAAEIPAVAELAQFVGDLVPAHLHLVERRAIKDGKTSRFVVPVLDLQIGTARLKEIVAEVSGQTSPALAGQQQAPAIEAPRPDYSALLHDATSVDDCQAIWRRAGEAGHLTDDLKAAITARARELSPQTPESEPDASSSAPDTDSGPDADQVWMQIVAAAGKLDMSDAALREALQASQDVSAEDANAEQLSAFLRELTTGERAS